MTKPASRRLKVFQAQFGFYDTVVAAPSRAAALRAWGTHQDLFADGQARVADDAEAIKAALAHPETPLRRVVGAAGPFVLEPTGSPELPPAPERPRQSAPAKANPEPAPPPPADRTALTAAEAAAQTLDDDHARAEAQLRRRQEALDAEREAEQGAYDDARKAADAALAKARAAYRKAGGAD